MNLFFDIETIPADEKFREIAVGLSLKKKLAKEHKTRISKPKTSQALEKLYRESAISGDLGRIFCIGYAMGDGPVEIIKGDEVAILKNWWQLADRADLFIGHNIMEFDMRFIFKRSIVNKIKPSAKHLNLSFARYRNYPIYDTMREWEKWSTSFISLDTLAKALGLESSKNDGIDGSQVFDFYLAGKHQEIFDYCMRDVELTRKIYKLMVFER